MEHPCNTIHRSLDIRSCSISMLFLILGSGHPTGNRHDASCCGLLYREKSKSKRNLAALKNPALVVLIFLVSQLLSSCQPRPEPIHYGQDACDFCRMTIVDKQHAAQMVTEKGRVYKYDAIECMLNDLKTGTDRPYNITSWLTTRILASSPMR